MNDPYAAPTLNLTDLDEAAWRSYMSSNARAKDEYARRPIARPHLSGHALCLCCDVLTVQPSTICLKCQVTSTEWADLAADPGRVADLRRANKRMPSQLRRVVFA
jgi:hypothetical protein